MPRLPRDASLTIRDGLVEGYAFRASSIQEDDRGVWLYDPLPSALVLLDHESETVSEPIELPRRTVWLVHGSSAWGWGNDAPVTSVDLRTGASKEYELAPHLHVFGDGKLLVYRREEEVWELPEDGGSPKQVGWSVPKGCRLELGAGKLWRSGWPHGTERLHRSLLASLEWETGDPITKMEFDRRSFRLFANAAGVWLYEQVSDQRRWTGHFVEIDPETLEPISEHRLASGYVVYDLIDRVALVGPHGRLWERFQPSRLYHLDLRTGKYLAATEVPEQPLVRTACANLAAWAGSATAWWILRGSGRSNPRVMGIRARASEAELFDLDGVNLAEFDIRVPADAPQVEQSSCEAVAKALRTGFQRVEPETKEVIETLPYIDGVTIEDVRLWGAYPDTSIVITFRQDRRPELLFARAIPIWTAAGEPVTPWAIDPLYLKEDVEACGYGLPANPEPDDVGLIWF